MSCSMAKSSKLINLIDNNNMDSLIILLSAIVSINAFIFYFNAFLGTSILYLNVIHGALLLLTFLLFVNKKFKTVFKIIAIYVFLEYYAKGLSSNVKSVLDLIGSKVNDAFSSMCNNKLYIDFSYIFQEILAISVLIIALSLVHIILVKHDSINETKEKEEVKAVFKSITHIFTIKNENYGFRYNAIP